MATECAPGHRQFSFAQVSGGVGGSANLSWAAGRAGIDWQPFAGEELRVDLMRVVGPECWCVVSARADALRRLGLHPDQPTSRVAGPSPPGWWHAAAERRCLG